MKEGWEVKKLGEVCEKITDGSHNPPKGIEVSDYFMISSQNIFNDKIIYDDVRYLSKEDFIKEDKRTNVNQGDVLLTIVGTVGRCAVFTDDRHLTLQRSVAVLKPKSDLSSKYLMYSLIGMSESLNKQAHGIAQKGLYLKQLSQIPIPVPPLPTQERIVSELDCINSIIEKKREQLKELDTLAQSIFYDMFGDPIRNEKGWEVRKLGEVAESDLGKTLNQSKDTGTLYPYLCAINIQWNTVDLSTLKQTKFEDSELTRYSVRKGDLLICEGGDIGRSAIWKKDEPMLYQNALHRVRFGDSIHPRFCLQYLYILKINGILDSQYGKGVTIKHLVKSSLLSIPIIVPPLPLQHEFAAKIEAIEKQKELIKRSIAEVETLLASRMQYYFG